VGGLKTQLHNHKRHHGAWLGISRERESYSEKKEKEKEERENRESRERSQSTIVEERSE